MKYLFPRSILSCLVLLIGWARPVPAVAAPKEARVAVIVGSNVGVENERPLQFAEQDADRFAGLLTDMGGIEKDRVYLVKGGDAAAVMQAVNEAKGRILELAKLGPTALIVYVSSHADAQNLHLEGTLLSIDGLRKSVQAAPAALRLVIVDACRTPASVQRKGGAPGPTVAVKLNGSEKLQGDLFISSSSLGEPAQEWSFLRGALFTHHMVTGLRGAADVDGNGRVSLSESYSYAFRQTLANAVTAGPGAQHPSFDFQMKGFGDWTFTTPGTQRAALVLDRDIAGNVWVVDDRNNIAAEVTKAVGAPLRLAVRPGWYRVILPKDQRVARAADVTLTWGKERVVRDADLSTISLRDAAARGKKPVKLRPVLLSAKYAFSSGDVKGVPFYHSGALSLQAVVYHWTAGIHVGLGRAQFENDRATVVQIELPLLGRFGHEFVIRLLALHVGLYGGAGLAIQNISLENQADRDTVSLEPPAAIHAWIPETGLYLSLLIPLTEQFLLTVDGDTGLKWVPVGDETRVRFSGRIGAGIGVRF